MHPLKGKKQSPEHVAKRLAAMKGKKRKAGSGRPKNTDSVLWNKVDKSSENECWPWTGWINGGYGRVEINKRNYYAHRVIFDIANPGLISRESPGGTSDKLVLHKCNNRICCNPSHLYLGTHKDNMQDRLKTGDGYRNLPKGEHHHAAVMSDTNRAELIELYSTREMKAKELAMRFGINRNTVKSILYWHKRHERS